MDSALTLLGNGFDKLSNFATTIYGDKVTADQTARQYELQQQTLQYQLAQQQAANQKALQFSNQASTISLLIVWGTVAAAVGLAYHFFVKELR